MIINDNVEMRENLQKKKGDIYKVNHIIIDNCPRVLNMEPDYC